MKPLATAALTLAWIACTTLAAETARNDERNWPTLHGDVQRSGFYPKFPRDPLKLVWRKELWRELTGPRAEVIVGGNVASFMPGGPGMRRKLKGCRAKLFLVFGVFSFDILRAQNIIDLNSEVDSSALAANPAKLTETDFSEFIWQFADYEPGPDRPEVRRILARLEAQVVKLIEGVPWMPFHHTLGISGYEVCYIEKGACALWASGGRPWKKVP